MAEYSDIVLIAILAMLDEVIVGSSSAGILILGIIVYRKSPGRKKRVAEKRALEKREWRNTLDQRLRETGLGA